jgi:hypothetical protein
MTTLAKLAHIRSSATFSPLTGFPAVPASWTPGSTSYPFEFVQFHRSSKSETNPAAPVEVTTDVVIIGSGCGAGVVATRLAKVFGSSLNVLVLEKGRHFDASHFPLSQTAGLSTMFEAGGVIETDDGSMTITAGSCFGGGGGRLPKLPFFSCLPFYGRHNHASAPELLPRLPMPYWHITKDITDVVGHMQW